MIINTLTEYINAIEKLKKNYSYGTNKYKTQEHENKRAVPNFIYRGQGNYKKNILMPGALRWTKTSDGDDIGEYSQLEYNILADFISDGCRYIMDVATNDLIAWMEIAQHFGAPTRLLDFTENPLVALYFACSNQIDTNASVWIVNETAYNETYFGSQILFPTHTNKLIDGIVDSEIMRLENSDGKYSSEFPVIYRPAYREERMSAQSSVFMLWGSRRASLTDIISAHQHMVFDGDPDNTQSGILCYLEIPKSSKKQILSQLSELGVNEKFIFPGLDGVGKYIRKKYSANKGVK